MTEQDLPVMQIDHKIKITEELLDITHNIV